MAGRFAGTAYGFARRKPLGAMGAVVLLLAAFAAVFAPQLAPFDPFKVEAGPQLDAPNLRTLLGTDELGRDVLSRLLYGARISMYVGVISVLSSIVLGTLLGIVSAYFGGLVDLLSQRLVDALMAFPALILALAIIATLGPSTNNVVIALIVVFVPGITRTVRSQALSIKEDDYVMAAQALGASSWRIMLRHIAPNTFGTSLVLASLTLGWAIVTEASLSFLGLGTPPDIPSWGGMLHGGASVFLEVAPWLGVTPGMAIFLVVFAANFLGDALRDELDPKLSPQTRPIRS